MFEYPYIASANGGVTIRVKVVPGASRDQVVGRLGDALKVKVIAPAEGGKANKAVCALIAKALGVPKRQVRVTAGHTQPNKQLIVSGIDAASARQALAAG